MYLVLKENNECTGLIVWNIYEVEGRMEYERAHAGADYEYFICTRNSANKILVKTFIGGHNQLFEKLEDARTYARNGTDEYIKKLEKLIKDCSTTEYLFPGENNG